jgi:hypothetical protein
MKPLKDFCIFLPIGETMDERAAREFVIQQGESKWHGLYDYEVRQLPLVRTGSAPVGPDRIYIGEIADAERTGQ